MFPAASFKGKQVAVFGLARSGLACVEALRLGGAVVHAWDDSAPAAEKAKVKIAIEVVWNNFITKPEQLIQYVDDFKSEWVGAYFDTSNMIKYGVPPADWIRKLGKRMLKFDFKGYSKANGFKVAHLADENDIRVFPQR